MTEQPNVHGLASAEVAERVPRGQVNRAPRSDRAEYAASPPQLLTLFNALVVPAALALFALGDYRGAMAGQRHGRHQHADRPAAGSPGQVASRPAGPPGETQARVLRDGQPADIPAGDVVLGDHVLLAAGEPVVADGPVLEARFLEVDEALLTGESDPVPRRPGERLLSGSFCVAGEGMYRADQVGGRRLRPAHRHRRPHLPLHAQPAAARHRRADPHPDRHRAVILCILYVALYFAARLSVRNRTGAMIAATITSMVPQGLVLMATLAFTLGAVRMSRRGAVVQRLNAVESMAAVDVLCMDKTGTLTTNRLRLDRLSALGCGEDEAARASAAVRLRLGGRTQQERPGVADGSGEATGRN